MPKTAPNASATACTLKLPAALHQQIEAAAQAAGQETAEWMLAALQAAAERHQLGHQFMHDAQAAQRHLSESGQGHPWEEVRSYFARLAQHRAGHASLPPAPMARPID